MPLNTSPPEVEKVLKSSDGIEIFARTAGRSDNHSLVFTHGFAFSGHVFDELFKDEKLLREFYLVSYDVRGHGRSGKPKREEDHTSALYAADFAAVVKASMGATVACDVCAHLPPNAISGIVYVSGLPYIDRNVMNSLAAPGALDISSGLLSTDDVLYSNVAKIAFVDASFTDTSSVPVSVKLSWLGAATVQSPVDRQLVLSRAQDAEKLRQAGLKGLPLLLISASADKLIQCDLVEKEMKPYFKDLEVHTVKDGSHVVFYENQEEFVEVLTRFAKRVFRKKRPGSRL
ncbi:unnamed protein product [Cyclocybe aegerita]|uniref:AB hydrolase-1 domain-containing protein n=1 Tax=Cyclocybe aegerita TaxID=1973307 RepID=A0A8S0WRT4_CYCAE|nr:unnamed protein product [Cyclocybe aegerita]